MADVIVPYPRCVDDIICTNLFGLAKIFVHDLATLRTRKRSANLC
jgi:hypothetical protein